MTDTERTESTTEKVLGPRYARSLYGDSQPAIDDLAEAYHEASSWYPSFQASELPNAALLEHRAELRRHVSHAFKRYDHVPSVALPPSRRTPLAEIIRHRRSERNIDSGQIPVELLADLLDSAYGSTSPAGTEQGLLRSSPSAGALFPLDLYLFARRCNELQSGLYHVDSVQRRLELLSQPFPHDGISQAFIMDGAAEAAAIVAIVAVFWRSRFKYGLRGYRFALLEAGHVAQNLLLACTAADLPAVPLGGFFDARLNRLIDLNGVDEAAVYAVALGGSGSDSPPRMAQPAADAGRTISAGPT
jgi:SagB-type dehydrogenase family enzyme